MKKVLECQYCKSIITPNDTTCPKCGANCSEVIKKYQEEREKEAKEVYDKVSKSFKFPVFFIIGFSAIIFIFIIGTMILSFNSRRRIETIEGTTDEKIETTKYNASVESFEEYEYYDDFFQDCNTKEGYKRVAFYITFENTSDESIETYSFRSDLVLKAGEEIVKTSSLKARDHFCEVVKGKEEYNAFPSTKVLPKDKVGGYIGYEIPTNEPKIKFILENDQVIEMDNPVYE